MNKILTLLFIIAVAGCTTTAKLPLCPAIAKNSYPNGTEIHPVNKYTVDVMEKKDISAILLSEFTAEFSGYYSDIKWLEDNYSFLVCGFKPELELHPKATYISCMQHAVEWLKIVQSDEPELLMIDQTKFKANCVR